MTPEQFSIGRPRLQPHSYHSPSFADLDTPLTTYLKLANAPLQLFV